MLLRNTRRKFGALILALPLALGGCGTVASKMVGPDNTQGWGLGWGHPYEGVTGDYGTVKCMWEMSPPQHIALRLLVTVALVIDLPLSLVADTIVLPVDLLSRPKRPRTEWADC
jgi:uncharacterized protein YceK